MKVHKSGLTQYQDVYLQEGVWWIKCPECGVELHMDATRNGCSVSYHDDTLFTQCCWCKCLIELERKKGTQGGCDEKEGTGRDSQAGQATH